MIFQAHIGKDGKLSAEIPRFLWGKKIAILEADEVTDDLKEFGLSEADPWDILDIESIAADTGRPDGSVHHDHYLRNAENMTPVFADTAALIALGDRGDGFHLQAIAVRDELKKNNRNFVTTDAVILELASYFSQSDNRRIAITLIEAINQSKKWKNIPTERLLIKRCFERYKKAQRSRVAKAQRLLSQHKPLCLCAFEPLCLFSHLTGSDGIV